MAQYFKSELEIGDMITPEIARVIIDFASALYSKNFSDVSGLYIREYVFEECVKFVSTERIAKFQHITVNNIKYRKTKNKKELTVYFWLIREYGLVSDLFFTIVFTEKEALFVAIQNYKFSCELP
ncbi:MAG: hypothetical protein O9322_05635 [Beijerinckiaceae bacterium]|nr:hypothetical protein [Beijerinckiaceae bacterium]MCZ8299003.1 hypothetical protein [Beijerinckiaceae bacterium]